MGKPHICFVAPYIYPILVRSHDISIVGGAEIQQAFIISGLKRLGYRITVLTNDFGQQDIIDTEGITIRKIPKNKGRLPFFRFFYPGITNLINCLRLIDADIYYQRSASWISGAIGWYSKRYGKSYVYSAACDLDMSTQETHKLFNYPLGWRGLWLYRYGVRRSSVIVVQNHQQQAKGRTWLKQPFYLISSCFQPLSLFEPAIHGGPVLWVSVLRTGKRPEIFIELARRLPYIRFILVGGPDQGEKGKELYKSIERAARELPNVLFTGFLPYEKADALFNNISLFINTSDFEGFPNTFLQAWARGAPTISFVNSGAQDIHGKIGSVVDDLDSMVQAVQQFHQQPEYWETESKRCKNYFQTQHHLDSVVSQYDHLFMQLVSSSGLQPKHGA